MFGWNNNIVLFVISALEEWTSGGGRCDKNFASSILVKHYLDLILHSFSEEKLQLVQAEWRNQLVWICVTKEEFFNTSDCRGKVKCVDTKNDNGFA